MSFVIYLLSGEAGTPRPGTPSSVHSGELPATRVTYLHPFRSFYTVLQLIIIISVFKRLFQESNTCNMRQSSLFIHRENQKLILYK